jgi:tetrahydromethanopterin S-methyltransferase subunit G
MSNYNEKKIDSILKLVLQELDSATGKFGAFNSTHEGYAVILEEMDELEDEVERIRGEWNYKEIKDRFNKIKKSLNFLWGDIKDQKSEESRRRMLSEAIQVAAMSIRFIHDIWR